MHRELTAVGAASAGPGGAGAPPLSDRPGLPARHFGVVAPAFPSHFAAMAALAGELIARGHRVTFFQRPDGADLLAATHCGDAAFYPLGAARFPRGSLAAALQRAANPGSPLGLRRVIADMAEATDMLCEELPRAVTSLGIDVMIADQMEASGAIVARSLGLPWISVACALPVNREAGVPLPVMPFGYDPGPRGLHMVEGSTRVYDWCMGPQRAAIARQARRLGAHAPVPAAGPAPGGDGLHDWLSPLLQLSQTIAGFDFPRSQLPAHFHHVGPLRPTSGRQTGTPMAAGSAHRVTGAATGAGSGVPAIGQPGTAAVPAPLPPFASDRPLVFASLGTLQGQRFHTFRRIARACRQLDVQLVLAHCGGLDARQAQALAAAGPAGATTVCAFAPQQAVLARADAVVTHAGLNTVMDAIAARTPMLALPIAFDQPGAAARIRHAGIGLCTSARFSSADTLAERLQQLLNDPAYTRRLDPLAAELAASGGTMRAVDLIEQALAAAPTPSLSAHAT